ncbi:coiled-coil domain-containing protein 178-like [Phascolarctos cinereus]
MAFLLRHPHRKELKSAEDISKHYSTEAEKVQKELDWNKEELLSMSEGKKEVVNQVETLTTALIELQEAVNLQAQKIKQLEKECEDSLTEYLDVKKFWNNEIQKLQNELEGVLMKTDSLLHANTSLVEENQATLQGIKDSLNRKGEYDDTILELVKLKTKDDEMLQKLLKDIAHVVNIYNATKRKTDEWEQKLLEERKKFMFLEAYFKKLIREQAGIGLMVKNRMATVLIEQEEKKYTEGKKSEVLQAFADIEAPFLELLEEAEKVKNIEEEHTKTIQNMGERKEKIKRQMIEVKTNLDQRKMSIKEAIEAAEERRVSVTNQIEVAKKTIVTVTNKIKDTKVAYEAKMEEKETLDKKLNKLRKIFGFAKCKTENSKQLYDTFFTELKNLEVRTDWDKRTIEYILLSRRETLQRKTPPTSWAGSIYNWCLPIMAAAVDLVF